MLCLFFLQRSENWSILGDVNLLLESKFFMKASERILFSIGPDNIQLISKLGSRATRSHTEHKEILNVKFNVDNLAQGEMISALNNKSSIGTWG